MTRGLYIHIPFCLSKCTYCDFYSVAMDTNLMEKYVDALVKEIELASAKNENHVIDTIYFGGGTPSVLPLYLLEKIVTAIHKNFSVASKEFTIEANPATNIDFLAYKSMGFDRISLGVQSLTDNLLRIIGRGHDAKLALNTIEKANNYFDKVSCDLMIGLPMQSIDDVSHSADQLACLCKHISMYMLKLSDSVKMANQIKQGKFTLPDDDAFVDYYETAFAIFRDHGLSRYEISNFAVSGYESKHNQKYWNRDEYIGLGASAHGFIDNYRYSNPSSIKDYIFGINYGNDNVPLDFINKNSALFEKIMLGFRLPHGINVLEINKEFNIDFEHKYKKQLSFLKPILIKDGGNIYIREDKLLLESAVAREFLD